MPAAIRAAVVRREDRDEVVDYLAQDARGNLLLLDMAVRVGRRGAPGELRAELAVARREGAIVGVAGLRPSVALDAVSDSEAIEAFLPFIETLGVGLVKSGVRGVDALWDELLRRAPRRPLLDRHETAYAVQPTVAILASGVARPAVAGDLEPLVVAARESLREEGRPDPFEGDVRNFRRWVRGRLPRARVVEERGRIVCVGYADVQRADGWLLQGVYTWPEARGRGHASCGVSALCREAFEAGADHVQLAVVEGNAAGVRLYEKLGFQPFARLRTILFSRA
ncbi:MAG: GNAT family N-acetyltransferase [Deltaproteobacteria bacterium]|nr:GNAT family N-acetyltransferase [Deltaproteobacteria bacterium]MBW2360179.1 GNAT family N-acetyltransferase [Deltaproteobacteria bacterium]